MVAEKTRIGLGLMDGGEIPFTVLGFEILAQQSFSA
jgi:hypothetical protein